MNYRIERRRPLVRGTISFAAAAALLSTSLTPANAWGLKTHVWIAQQVLNDAQDGTVEIGGRTYKVAPHVLEALLAHPERYRAGALGPDVYPDPLAGQTTTHPGVPNGWGADEFLGYLGSQASHGAETAFSYGYASHFAGDIFAHTYVNAYSGSVFDILDGELDGERRHVAIEKYLDGRIPAALDNSGRQIAAGDIKAPTSFLRDALILDAPPSRQYRKVKATMHLAAMYAVHRNVNELDKEAAKLEDRLSAFRLPHVQLQLDTALKLVKARDAVKVAKLGLTVRRGELAVLRAEQAVAEAGLGAAQKIVREYPEELNIQQKLLTEQIKFAVDAGTELLRVIDDAQRIMDEAQSRVSHLRGEVASWACELIFWDSKKRKKCKKKIRSANEQISNLEGTISGQKSRVEASRKALEIAEANREGTKRTIDRISGELARAQAGLADGTLQAAIDLSRAKVKAHEELIRQEEKLLEAAEKLASEIDAKLAEINAKLQEIAHAGSAFTLARAVLRKWIGDMEFATEEYIKASDNAGRKLYALEGNPIDDYARWYRCYAPVFTGVPSEVGEVNCFVGDELSRVKAEFDRFVQGLPELVRWMIQPSKELQRTIVRRMGPEIREAKNAIGNVTPGADLLLLLSDPSYADRGKLNQVLSTDTSSNKLLKLQGGADLIDADALTNGAVDPAKFAPLMHSVTMAKLALLDETQLNRLIADLAPEHRPPTPTYSAGTKNSTILHGAVRSLDGNHQWQAYGLPHPRRSGNLDHPKNHAYGRDPFQGDGAGLKIWTDRYLRENVFLKLFPTQVIGKLGEAPELQSPRYGFPSCPAYPFPSTQDAEGKFVTKDLTCLSLGAPAAPSERRFLDVAEYKERYFGCSAPLGGPGFVTVVASYGSREAAARKVTEIQASFPDMAAEATRVSGKGSKWLVATAKCVDQAKATEARELAILRGFGTQSYIVEQSAPVAD